jgi:hypothetical protein
MDSAYQTYVVLNFMIFPSRFPFEELIKIYFHWFVRLSYVFLNFALLNRRAEIAMFYNKLIDLHQNLTGK